MAHMKRIWGRYLELSKRLTGWKRFLFYLLHYTILFLITFWLSYSPFWRAEKSFIWISDGRNQHYPTLVYIGRYLRQIVLHLLNGEIAIPLFDMSLAMGSDIIATLNFFGLGNPLDLLSVFVPAYYAEYLYNFLVVLRLYLAGLSFWALCAHNKKGAPYAWIGALVYVFSGYAIISAVRHPFFIDPMIQLPLLLIGIDNVIQKKKSTVFVLSVFFSALCGFYFLYMMTIMLGFYALIRFFDYYNENRWKNFFAMVGRIIGAYLLGLGLSAPIFFPAVIGFFTSARSGKAVIDNYFSYGRNFYIQSILDLIAPPGSWNTFPFAAFVLLALVVLLLFSRKQRRSLKLLLFVAALFYCLPLGGHIMNGFSYSTTRWTFGIALLLSYVLVETFPDLLAMGRTQQLSCFFVVILYSVIVFCRGQNRTIYHVTGVAMLALALATLYLFGGQNGDGKRIGALACAAVVSFNVGINAIYRFSGRNENYVGEFTTCGSETNRLQTIIEREAEPYLEAADGRFDGTSFSINGGMVWHVPTPYVFWSMIGTPITMFGERVENVDMRSLLNTSGLNKRTGLEALFSTKYLIERKDTTYQVPYGYSVIDETGNGSLIYENQYALPWGYTYDSYILADEAKSMNGLEIEETMLQSIILNEDIPNITKSPIKSNISEVQYEITDSKDIEWESGVLTTKTDNATMTLNFHMPATAEGYVRLQGFDINGSGASYVYVTATCGDISKNAFASSEKYTWYWGRENYLINLGYDEEERTSCTITFAKKGIYKLDNIQLFALPMDKYPDQIDALRKEPLKDIKFGTNQIIGTVDLSENKILCMSIPYNKGWTAKVDGKKVNVFQGNYMFMAIPLTKGYHNIEFTYCPQGLKIGLAVFFLSSATAIYLIWRKRK